VGVGRGEVEMEEKGVEVGDESTFQLSTRHWVGTNWAVPAVTLLLRQVWSLGHTITNLSAGESSHYCHTVSPLGAYAPPSHIIVLVDLGVTYDKMILILFWRMLKVEHFQECMKFLSLNI
jgi:hypothetical protein